jgi:hypothetical protein
MKTLAMLLSLFFCTILLNAQSQTPAPVQTQIQSGNFAFNATVEGYTLDKNVGERSTSIEITFAKPFEKKPKIVLTVCMFDGDTKSNVRYKIEPYSISRDGFMIRATTWSESKIYELRGNWIAHLEN